MSTPQTIIIQAMFDLGAVAAGETPSPSELADGLVRLNQMVASWSTEGATVFNQVVAPFALSPGQGAYTLGQGGSWNTNQRAQKITAWRATSGLFTSGGQPLPFGEFDQAAQAASVTFATIAAKIAAQEAELVAQVTAGLAPFFLSPGAMLFPNLLLSNAAVPMVLGCDTAWPQINVRVFPVPTQGAPLELTYWTPIPQFGTLLDVINLPPGYEDALHFNLGIALAPQYGRTSGVDTVLAAKAQQSKASIVQQNTMQQAPQQQPTAQG